MSASAYEIRSELRGVRWAAWVVRSPDGRPDHSGLLVGQTREEAESRARDWAEGKVG